MIAMDAITRRRYRVFKRYSPAGKLTERGTGKRYNLVKVYV